MLTKIKVESLFNRFDYILDFSNKKMSLITGPNGFGKTTILNMIRDVLDDDLYHLSSIPFKKVVMQADSEKELTIEKNEQGFFINSFKLYVPNSITFDNKNKPIFVINPNDINELRIKHKKYFIPQQVLTVNELTVGEIEAYTNDILLRINYQLIGQEVLKVVEDILRFYKNVGNTIYCSADRLYNYYPINGGSQNRKSSYTEVINFLPERMNDLFGKYSSRYTQVSNDLDFTFVSQLNEEIANGTVEEQKYSKEDFNNDMEIINSRLDKLASYGFLYREKLYNKAITFNDEYSVVFKIFANNYLKKLDVLEKLTKELSLFQCIVNTKLINKQIVIKNNRNINNIIQVKDGDTVIPLDLLSSGEKEIIVMYYNLLFESNNDLIALVDEPELSSHVSWQYEALDDFRKIMEVNDSLKQIIVCTHSPQIVGNQWEDVIDLFEQSKFENNESH